MKIKKLLDLGILRLVPLKNGSSGWYKPYKNQPVESYQNNMGNTMALVNVKGKIAYKKASLELEDIKDKTYVSKTGVALIYLNDEQEGYNEYASKTKFIVVEVNNDLLEADVADLTSLNTFDSRFLNIACKFVKNPDSLSAREVVALVCDYRTYDTFDQKDLNTLYRTIESDDELVEVFEHSTTRSKLLLYEIKSGVQHPKTLKLFKKSNNLKSLVTLK